MKKYKYPESIRCLDFEWLDKWCKDNACDSTYIKSQIQSIIQNEMEITSDGINEWVDSIGRLISSEKDKLDMLLNIANQIENKFEEVV